MDWVNNEGENMKKKIPKFKRLNTQLEATGAEYLVLGELLRRRIQAFITSQNFEAYDIVAVNPKYNKAVKIQVKSRFGKKELAFPITKLDTHFVIFVKLNIERISENSFNYPEPPEMFVLPINVVKKYRREAGWKKVIFKKEILKEYRDRWDLIKKELKL